MPVKYAKVNGVGLDEHSDVQHTHASETSTLLAHSSVEPNNNVKAEGEKPFQLSQRLIVVAMMMAIVVMSCGDRLSESPLQRIMESVICYEYYEKEDPSKLSTSRETIGPGAIGGVSEMLCKIDPVQDRLAKLDGYQGLFDGLPSLLLSMPFGWAADHYGRRPFVLMGLFAFALRQIMIQIVLWFWQVFDIKLVWLSAMSGVLGGGEISTSNLLIVVISDVTRASERATLFMQMVAANLGAGLVMPLAAAWLMQISPWIPCLCGTILLIAAIAVYLPIPETLNYFERNSIATPPSENSMANADEISSNTEPHTAYGWSELSKSAMAVFTRDWRVPALILTYTTHYLCGSLTPLLMQYISIRYSMSFSKATLILTIRAAVTMVLSLAILPALSHIITVRWRLSPQRKDLILSRASAVFWSLGYFLIGFAPNVAGIAIAFVVGSLGVGVSMLIRAFITSLVPSNQVARVYACIGIIDTVGVMVGSPLLAWLFEVGLGIGNGWLGLPFYVLGLFTSGIAVVTFMIRLEKGDEEVLAVYP